MVGGLPPIDLAAVGTLVARMEGNIMINILITCDECGAELRLPANKPEAIDIYQRSGGMVSTFTEYAMCSPCAVVARSETSRGGRPNALNS